MRRSLIILLALAFSAGALFLGAARVSSRFCCERVWAAADELEWLRQEFNLGSEQLQRVRALHEGYKPVCRSFCEQIDDRKREVRQLLGEGLSVTPEVEHKLADIGALRAKCQAAMLRHFDEVSRAMPAAEGQRYLAEMRRLTVESHEQIESSMTRPDHAAHGH
jgi:hypothetical protein